MSCTPMITPADCAPYAPTPVLTATPTNSPEIHVVPTMPPIGLESDPIGWVPELSEVSLDGVADGALLMAVCVVAILVMTIMILVPATMFGWQPTRLRNWLIGSLLAMPGATALWAWDVLAPGTMATEASRQFMDGQYTAGLLGMAVVLVPMAWLTATVAHANRRVQLATVGLKSPARTERALWAQAQREQRAAARLSRRRLPFTSGWVSPQLVIGRLSTQTDQAPPQNVLRTLFGRTETRLILPWINVAEHMTSVASSGSGKTTLMLRVLVSWFVTTWTRHRQWWRADRPGRPLVVVVDCNGGPESRKVAARMRKWFSALGVRADRIGIFPDDVSLGMWNATVEDLRSILSAMISGGSTPTTDTERYFHEIRETLIHLIVDAPARVELIDGVPTPVGENPPRSWLEFLSRFDVEKLSALWGGQAGVTPWSGVQGIDMEIASTIDGKQPVMNSARAEFANLYRSLGNAFDGDKELTDFDLIYIVLEGVKTPDRARSQFGALGTMFEQLADKQHGRTSLLVVDEFSAVSDGKTRAVKWVERLRKAGIGSWWIAQSWQGLGHDDDNRTALVSAASGGSLLGRSTDPETLAKIYGTRPKFELSRKLIGGNAAGDEGNVQSSDQFLVPPNRLRAMQKGDVVQVSGGRARWGRVSPLDDGELKRMRPLAGLDRFTDTEASDPADLAPVIDMSKRRPA
ncbi:AAA family ATPase [Nocardia sp. XZ_19_231]|uniref:AAA family ATPase n=1 Tax=Nocardia sp. XZ_19_231 TaxID=2769252 RepID=UPI00188EFFD2|nr:AAA family ATPase [Nocardia sp. XZ_19_231]